MASQEENASPLRLIMDLNGPHYCQSLIMTGLPALDCVPFVLIERKLAS